MTVAMGLLILVAGLLVFALGVIGVLKVQNAQLAKLGRDGIPTFTAPSGDAPSAFQQAPSQTREAYVREHWQRPGVVANGVTLLDLYDRINELERRLAETERQLNPVRRPD